MTMSDACWLSEVCECGAITEGDAPVCWRCGTPRPGHVMTEDDDAADATSRQ